MKRNITIYCLLALATILGLSACSENDNSIPEGMGKVEIRLTSRYHKATRASGDWLDPDPNRSEELIHDYFVVFVNSSNIVEEIAQGNANGKEEDTFRFLLPPGNYTVYAFANLPEDIPANGEDPAIPGTPFSSLGIVKGSALPDLTTMKIATSNGWTRNIPMTSHTGGQSVTVYEAENQTFQIELIRTMAKIELTFINNSQQRMGIVGYEISPLTKTNYVSLLEPTDPEHIVTTESESFAVNREDDPLKLPAMTPTMLVPTSQTAEAFYVNETNASATSTENQYSIRIKARRYRNAEEEDDEDDDPNNYVIDYRYGFTVNSETSGMSFDPLKEDGEGDNINGFNYIRRNDWIKLPIMFTDWTFRIEALPFPPIAGFQARVLSTDALSITFNSGGYIFLRPMFRNNADPEGVWRGFDDSDVTFVLPPEPYTVNGEPAVAQTITDTQQYAWTTPLTHNSVAESIDPVTGTGIVLTGDLGILEQRFVQLPSGDIVGKLTNSKTVDVTDPSKTVGMITVTLKLKLDGFAYQFNYNIYEQN
ncbi:MAG: FimB/Mfa2 family fimbrial subunit [Bacteroidaceae bacterium]|nr:FimB/Mfa2 family fimbrial subunit [Bacteroidaceae bacterium]